MNLGHGLRQRHVSMLALGGAIGAGLFVGSGVGIRAAGPAIIISYALAGVLTLLVMRMLTEMASVSPDSGTFSTYAERALGGWAGFTIGWLYWWVLSVVIAAESTAAAAILHAWIPTVPQWLFALLCMVTFTSVNLAAVASFGEFEFWFAGIKVAAIIAFIALGTAAILGLLPGVSVDVWDNLTGHGGFAPHGWEGVIAALLTVAFAFGGIEVVTIAAVESEHPAQAIGRAMRSALWRILIFFIGSMAVIVMVLPWDEVQPGRSPFVLALDQMGIPGAGTTIEIVVLIALLSALNANMYAASRMVYSLAERGEAPRTFLSVSRWGIPWLCVIASAGFGFCGVTLNYVWPDTAFPILANSVGAGMLFIWLAVTASQLVLRRRFDQSGVRPLVRMWAFPYLSWLTLAGLVALMALMMTNGVTRTQLLGTVAVIAILLAAFFWRSRMGSFRMRM